MHDDESAGHGTPAEPERRRRERRGGQLAIFADRRLGERRRTMRGLLDRLRSFLGLPPLS
jgi:hypothetical protein